MCEILYILLPKSFQVIRVSLLKGKNTYGPHATYYAYHNKNACEWHLRAPLALKS